MFSKTWSPFWQPHKIFRSIFLDPLPFPDAEDLFRLLWQALENGRRWRTAGIGEWSALENGRRWRMAGAGEWQVLENGRRWVGLADEVGSDAIPDAAGGEGGNGTAKPDRVIPRTFFTVSS